MSVITMTESLAVGLTNRFFSEAKERGAETVRLFRRTEIHRSWHKLAPTLRSQLGDRLLCSYEGGSKRHPYLALDIVSALGSREYNTWNEKCLTAVTILLVGEPRLIECMRSCYSIGEHTIRRLFLRTEPVFRGNTIDAQAVSDQLAHVPLWANFWLNALIAAEDQDLHEKCKPIVPAPDGLLLGEYNLRLKTLEIRTFVDDKHLAEDQRLAKQLMLDVMSTFDPSPLCFTMVATRFALDEPYYLHCCLANRVREHPGYSAFLNTVFRRVEDSGRREAKSAFESHLRRDGRKAQEGGLETALQSLGVAKFSAQVRKGVLQAGGTSFPLDAR